ncbi:MAG TPA: hypothetical protein VGS23_03325 [Thermoplasmata archaeon]|nr:hypothetical protein [Thermoplasmata archaeon]
MSGRPASPPARAQEPGGAPGPNASLPRLRLEILQELQQLIENREARDRIDRGPLAETKGREHWVLHLLLRAQESAQAHTDRLIGSSYANLTSRLQSIEDRVAAFAESESAARADLTGRLDVLSTSFSERLERGFTEGTERIAETAGGRLSKELRETWRPIGESIESFSQGSKEMVKQVSDTYKVATQTRLLLNENARRISDLGRDLLALEDSLKLVVQRAIEESFGSLEQRIAQLESRVGIAPPAIEADPPAVGVGAGDERSKPSEPDPGA